jgi:hypothetical protein
MFSIQLVKYRSAQSMHLAKLGGWRTEIMLFYSLNYLHNGFFLLVCSYSVSVRADRSAGDRD